MSELSDIISRRHHLSYIQFYSMSASPAISAVWTKKTYRNLFQRHDVTKYGFLLELRESMQCNRPVLFVSAYEYEGVVYFATIWDVLVRKSSSKISSHSKGFGSLLTADITTANTHVPCKQTTHRKARKRKMWWHEHSTKGYP